MKKILLPALILITFGFTAMSCEKCTTCTYEYTINGNPATYSEDFCGSKSEVESFEDDFTSDATAVMSTATCTRN